MKIDIHIDQYVEADITSGEIIDAMLGGLSTKNVDSVRAVQSLISNIASILTRVPDPVVAAMSPEAKKIIHDTLRREASRYSTLAGDNDGCDYV